MYICFCTGKNVAIEMRAFYYRLREVDACVHSFRILVVIFGPLRLFMEYCIQEMNLRTETQCTSCYG